MLCPRVFLFVLRIARVMSQRSLHLSITSPTILLGHIDRNYVLLLCH